MNVDNRVHTFLKKSFERIQNEKIKSTLLQAVPFWVASLITGLIAVIYTKLFAGAESISAYFIHGHMPWFFLITPVLFLLAFFIVQKFAPYAKGSGIPQVMLAIDLATPKDNHKVRKLLSIKVIVVKIISNLLVAIGGAAPGREGPTIQIAGSVFRKVLQWPPHSIHPSAALSLLLKN